MKTQDEIILDSVGASPEEAIHKACHSIQRSSFLMDDDVKRTAIAEKTMPLLIADIIINARLLYLMYNAEDGLVDKYIETRIKALEEGAKND